MIATDLAGAVLEEVNARHRRSWSLGPRLAGGYQSGAYLITDSSGGRAVLKWSEVRDWVAVVVEAEAAVRVARAAGRPTPAWLAAGETAAGYPYEICEFVAGEAQEVVTHAWLDAVLPVVAGQAGLGRDGMRNWSDYDREVVFGAHRNRSSVAASGPAGLRLDEVITAVTACFTSVVLPTDDLVHGDFNPGNVLIADGRVAGLIDVEAIGRGTRLHDLSTLLTYAALWGERDTQARLLGECRRVAKAGWMEISLSAVLIDLMAFGVRHWPSGDLADLCSVSAELLLDVAGGR